MLIHLSPDPRSLKFYKIHIMTSNDGVMSEELKESKLLSHFVFQWLCYA